MLPRRAADQRDELPPFHSITSSARPSSASGTVMPSDFAALRLTINSTFAACWDGEVSGLRALEYLGAIQADEAMRVGQAAAIANQSAPGGKIVISGNRRHRMTLGQCGDIFGHARQHIVGRDDQRADATVDNGRESGGKLRLISGIEHDHVLAKQLGGGLDISYPDFRNGTVCIDDKSAPTLSNMVLPPAPTGTGGKHHWFVTNLNLEL